MPNIQVKVFPARYGDSFYITIRDSEETHNILIDCGLVKTYRDHIKDEIKLDNKISLLVLTHIDNDHINGAIALFKDSNTINDIEIDNIWFNDLYKISKNKYVCNLSHKSEKENSADQKGECFNEDIGYSTAKTLANYIIESKHFCKWNKDSQVIECGSSLYKELYPINKNIKFVLLSPHSRRLEELFDDWCTELGIKEENLIINDENLELFYKYFLNMKDPRELFDEDCGAGSIDLEGLAEKEYYCDNLANDSSIAFFIEFQGKRILFLGDSHPSDINLSLKKYLEDNSLKRLEFDLVKVSHHGSKYNTESELFKYIYGKKYLISTNGDRDNHPDLECLAKIIVKQEEFKTILFNYRRKDILDELEDEELQKRYKYELVMPETDDEGIFSFEV